MLQANYVGRLKSEIDNVTGAKTFKVNPPIQNADGVLKTGIGTDHEEQFEIDSVNVGNSTVTTGLRGLSNITTSPLTEDPANIYSHYIGEKIAVVTFPNKIHDQNTDAGTTSTTFDINSSGNRARHDSVGLSANRTFTYPDGDGEFLINTGGQVLANMTLTNPIINGTVTGTALNVANGLVGLNGVGQLPALDGSLLTNLPSGFADPMTTAGDMIHRDATGTTTRLGRGGAGAKLKINTSGTTEAWMEATGSEVAASVSTNLDFSSQSNFPILLDQSAEFTFTNLYDGAFKGLTLRQDGTGSRTVTFKFRTENFGTGDVNTGTDEITVANDYRTGTRVQFSTTTTLPTGLSASTDYYVIRVSATTIQVATTRANAMAGTQIDITGTGSGTHTIDSFAWYPSGVAVTITTTAYAEDKLLLQYEDRVLSVFPVAYDIK